MKLFQTTAQWETWWANRKIDWKVAYQNWDHPHRTLLCAALSSFPWLSLFEVGCGGGANLIAIAKHFKGKSLGGADINPDAIQAANETFQGGMFMVNPVHDVMLSDSATDVILSDMCLIYVGPRKIDAAIEEIKRVARSKILLCEFHHTSFRKRLWLRYTSGYNAYDYRKLLEKHGLYDIEIYKIPEQYWPGGNPQKTFGYVIKASVPKRK